MGTIPALRVAALVLVALAAPDYLVEEVMINGRVETVEYARDAAPAELARVADAFCDRAGLARLSLIHI